MGELFETKSYKRSALDSVDQAIAKAVIENPTVTDEKIADSLGISRQTVNRRRNHPKVLFDVQRSLQVSEVDVKRLRKLAITRLENLVCSSDERIALGAVAILAKTLSIFEVTKENHADSVEIDVVDRQLEKIKSMLRDEGLAAPPVSWAEINNRSSS